MSLSSFLSSLNSPLLVSSAGLSTLAGLLAGSPAAASASLATLQGLNLGAFALSCAAVSVPGRIDGQQQDKSLRQGKGGGLLDTKEYNETYSPSRGRTLVAPSGWAFSIWGPIYLGEAIFCVAQFLPSTGLAEILPHLTVPFVAANVFQSLWCASFRPSYHTKESTFAPYVSPLMLAGTAFSLSQVHSVVTAAGASWYYVPLIMHFGWTTAATLVNLNGSVATAPSNSDTLVTGVGHLSAVAATALGVGVTVALSSPVYGWTVSWALAACADGMSKRLADTKSDNATALTMSQSLQTGANVQRMLCWTGAAACAVASAYIQFI